MWDNWTEFVALRPWPQNRWTCGHEPQQVVEQHLRNCCTWYCRCPCPWANQWYQLQSLLLQALRPGQLRQLSPLARCWKVCTLDLTGSQAAPFDLYSDSLLSNPQERVQNLWSHLCSRHWQHLLAQMYFESEPLLLAKFLGECFW